MSGSNGAGSMMKMTQLVQPGTTAIEKRKKLGTCFSTLAVSDFRDISSSSKWSSGSSPPARPERVLGEAFHGGCWRVCHVRGFPKIGGTLLGVPAIRILLVWGYIKGIPFFWKRPHQGRRGAESRRIGSFSQRKGTSSKLSSNVILFFICLYIYTYDLSVCIYISPYAHVSDM